MRLGIDLAADDLRSPAHRKGGDLGAQFIARFLQLERNLGLSIFDQSLAFT